MWFLEEKAPIVRARDTASTAAEIRKREAVLKFRRNSIDIVG